MVVGRRHLHDVDSAEGGAHGDAAHRVEQLTARESPGFGRAGARRRARVHHVDVDREEDRVAVVHRNDERLVEHRVQAPRDDLAHLEGPHALFGHPVQRLGLGPVAAQPDLHEPVAATGARLDQAAHRGAVAVERAHLRVASVGVGVEVDHRDASPPHVARDSRDVGQGDRVVAAQDHRDDARRGDRRDARLERGQRAFGIARGHLHVAEVHHAELDERVHAEREARAHAVVGQVVGDADGLWAEAAP